MKYDIEKIINIYIVYHLYLMNFLTYNIFYVYDLCINIIYAIHIYIYIIYHINQINSFILINFFYIFHILFYIILYIVFYILYSIFYIGAGTGLGECFLTCDSKSNYECYPSEGGHAEFAPRNDLEIKLLKFLSNKFNSKHRISVERLVSGTGLANIYEFLTIEYPNEINKNILEQINSALESDKGRIIATNTTLCKLCEKTMHIFTSAYGSEAGGKYYY